MNHIYRLIWNAELFSWVVAPETAKRQGKSSHGVAAVDVVGGGGAGAAGGAGRWRLAGSTLACLLAWQTVWAPSWLSAQIVTDGRTQTVVQTSGSVTTVTTSTVRGANAFNSFQTFSVATGTTANLVLPNGTNNLINLVRDQRTTISGVLNAIKAGQIGGNVYFANPNGFLISASGVVNVGSLTMTTPTAGFVQGFFNGPGNPSDAATAQLLGGTAPRNVNGQIDIQGTVNAAGGVRLAAGTIVVGGAVYSNASFTGTDPDFSDVVNVNGLPAGTRVVVQPGRIDIVADEQVTVRGSLSAWVNDSAPAGDISVQVQAQQTPLQDVEAGILLEGATIQGANVTMSASAAYSSRLSPVVVKTVRATVDVVDTQITAQGGDIRLSAAASVDSATGAIPIPASVLTLDSDAGVRVSGSSELNASGAAVLEASSNVLAQAKPTSALANLSGDGSVAISVIDSRATVSVGDQSRVETGGALSLLADNKVDVQSIADASAAGSDAAGASVAVSKVLSETLAAIEGQATADAGGALTLSAKADTKVTTTAKSATKGAQEDTSGNSESAKTLNEYGDTAQTSEGSVKVAGAIAVADVKSDTQARITSTGLVNTDAKLTVGADSLTQSHASADGSATGGTTGVGAAVAIQIANVSHAATLGDNTNVRSRGAEITALTQDGKDHAFSATAKSGAGASNVGVAGALGVNVVSNRAQAALEGDADSGGTGAELDAGGDDVRMEATNRSSSNVTVGADVTGSGDSAKVGVGASVGVNVVVNETEATVGDGARLAGARNLTMAAKAAHALANTVTGGASGAKISVTPVAATTVAVNRTEVRIGTAAGEVATSGKLDMSAEQTASSSATATGQTSGNRVAVGASVAVNISTDEARATLDRDVTAGGAVSVAADGRSTSSASATASVAGGQKADSNDEPAGSGGTPGKTVDEQVTAQKDSARRSGSAADSDAQDKIDQNDQTAPKAESSEGGVSVAAAVGVNVAKATTQAEVSTGRTVRSGGQARVTSTHDMDASSSADGSQVDNGKTNVGVGAAVALNLATSRNTAVVADDADLQSAGLVVKAVTTAGETQTTSATAKSGAGAENVGVAGALAVNVVDHVARAEVQGNENGVGTGAKVDAQGQDVTVEAHTASSNTVSVTSDVKGSGDNAKLGVGASIGVNVTSQITQARVGSGAVLTDAAKVRVAADAAHTASTTATGGASGAKVNITPVAAVTVSVNTTGASIDAGGTPVAMTGALEIDARQNSSVTTQATGRAQGNVAVGASLAAAIAKEDVSASLDRNVSGAGSASIEADSTSSLRTEAVAGAKGAAAKKKSDGEPEAGTTVDEQKQSQLNFAKNRNSATSSTDTSSPEARTPDTNTDQSGGSKAQGKKVSVAAAIGVSVAENQAKARIGQGVRVETTGRVDVKADTQTNYRTLATGEAVSDEIGIAAAVAVTATRNKTIAEVGAGSEITGATDVTVHARSRQNRDSAFVNTQSAEAVSGASGGEVAVAGALALVLNENETRASIDEGADIGTVADAVDHVKVHAEDTSKVAAQARAGALSKGGQSKAGVGASFAVLVSRSEVMASVGRDVAGSWGPSGLHVQSLTIRTDRHPVMLNPLPNIADVKSFNFDTLDPASYLGSNNYYTEAVAGAASKGDAAVSGAFSVNVFENITEAQLAQNVTVRSAGAQPQAVPGTPNAEQLGVAVQAQSGTRAISFAGAVAAAKKAGVGISNTDIINRDTVRASVGAGADVQANGTGAGVKVSAQAQQDITNVSVSAAAGTETAGVAGVLGVIVSDNTVVAEVGEGARVAALGDVGVTADNDSTLVMVTGGVAAGAKVGVGGSIAANIVRNTTQATLGRNAVVDAGRTVAVSAHADETVVTAVVAGAGGGKVGVAGAVSVNVVESTTEATIGQGAYVNTEAGYATSQQGVTVEAVADTTVVGVSGGGAGGGQVGVGAAADTTVLAKTVKAGIADDTLADGRQADVRAARDVRIEARASEDVASATIGFGGGGNVGVGGAVSLLIVESDIEAAIGNKARVRAQGNVKVHAEDDITGVLIAGGAAGGGTAGVGGSLGVAVLQGQTTARVGDEAQVTARGLGAAQQVTTGEAGKATEAAKGLAVTAHTREDLITTVASGAGGGSAGVAATVSANVIASETHARIGRNARINEDNAGAAADQQVRVQATGETLLVNTAAGAGGGGAAGVGAGANVGVVIKDVRATIGYGSVVRSRDDVRLGADAMTTTVGTTAGFAGGGSAGVGGAVAGVGIGGHTEASIEDAPGAGQAADIRVTGGDLDVSARSESTTTLATGAGAGGGAAGVGVSLAVAVNTGETVARIGDHAVTNASGTTRVAAQNTQHVNTVTVAGAGGGAAGVAGTISVNVVASDTRASIGQSARVNQDDSITSAAQSVAVTADDEIRTISAGGAGAGGGAAGVGGTADVTFVKNKTAAVIEQDAHVSAAKDVTVEAQADKDIHSVVIAGAGGGAAGVAGAVSVVAVGSLLDGEASDGLKGNNTAAYSDGQLTKSAVGSQMGTDARAQSARSTLDGNASALAVGSQMGATTADIPTQAVVAHVAQNTRVNAGEDLRVAAADRSTVVIAAGAGAGGGAAGVAGAFGVALLRDSATASIAAGAQANARQRTEVHATTSEDVYNVGIAGSGAGAADVSGAVVVNVVSSQTTALIGAAQVNQDAAYQSSAQSVDVKADSGTNLVTVGGTGGGAGAASVGAALDTNVLTKETRAIIGEGAQVKARDTVAVEAASRENIISAGLSIRGAGAAAVGAVATANVVNNVTEAYIGSHRDDTTKQAATVDSEGNVKLSATDDILIISASAVGNGAGAAGVGVNVGANVIGSVTRAYVGDDSVVNARGNAAATTVYSGAIGAATALPPVAGGRSGGIDLNGDGTSEGQVGSGISLQVQAQGSNGQGGANNTVDPSAQGLGPSAVAGATGGIGAKQTETTKGLSVTAINNEKVISTAIGVAGAGAAAVTGAASVNVITSQTEATVGDGAKINVSTPVGADPSVRVRAADHTFVVQTVGTVSGAGAAAVSGAVDTLVLEKQTRAEIGRAEVQARHVHVRAEGSDTLYGISANVSVGGAAGVGAAVGVAVISNETEARIRAGAQISASGNLAVEADQNSQIDLYTVSGAAGIGAVSGAFSVAVVDNTTRAEVEGATTSAGGAVLDASGSTEVVASGREAIRTATVSAAGGGVGVAGAVGVKVTKSTTTASIGNHAKVNQTRRGAAQDVTVRATDTVELSGGGGSAAIGAIAGAGAVADVNIVRNTTTASVGDNARVRADRDLTVSAESTKDVQSAAAAAAGGGSVGISGAVALAIVGAKLDADSQEGIGNGGTASKADEQIRQDKVSGQLDHSDRLQSSRTAIQSRTAGLGVGADLNDNRSSSLDKTRAFVGQDATLVTGRHVRVEATDRTQLRLDAVGAAAGFVGVGGAVGIGLTNSTTEAFIDARTTVDADGDLTVQANAQNVNGNGSLVTSAAGAGGVVGLSASVAVLKDTSQTKAKLENDVDVEDATATTVSATTNRRARTEAYGASAGALAVGASVARSTFEGSTRADLGQRVKVRGDDLSVTASDTSVASAKTVAGAAGILSGSGADAKASMTATVAATTGTQIDVVLTDDMVVQATSTVGVDAESFGVSVGAGAVGASLATATSAANVQAQVGDQAAITAADLDVRAERLVGSTPTARARATGAAGGLLLGANATVARADAGGRAEAGVGASSTLNVSGTTEVVAENRSLQAASSEGISAGIVAVGANFATANASSTTQASLGDNVRVVGQTLDVRANSDDANYAYSIAGSGGVVSAPFSEATTSNSSQTFARTGSGDNAASNARKIDVSQLHLSATHTSRFDSWIDSTNASLVGVSGAKATNTVSNVTETHVGAGGYVEADHITIAAANTVLKQSPGSTIPGLNVNTPAWNVNSSSGGLADVPAASSTTTISNRAAVNVGAAAKLVQTGLRTNPGTFRIDAFNQVTASDKAKLSSGGAISAASAKSVVLANNNQAIVNVATQAELSSVGDMALGARSVADVRAQAAVDVYGAVGVAPAGDSVASFMGTHTIDIASGSLLSSMRDVRLSAGASSTDQQTTVNTVARTDVYNNTAIPVNRDPVADAISQVHSQINIAQGAEVEASRHVMLYAEEGAVTASGVGIGKDLYREALAAVASAVSNAFGGGDVSFETRTGRSIKVQTSDVAVDGEVHVGIHRKQELVIGMDGTPTKQTDGISITGTGFRNVAADIIERIEDLKALIQEYTVTQTDANASIAVAAYQSEIRFLERKLEELGYQDQAGFSGVASISARQAAQEAIDGMTETSAGYQTTRGEKQSDNATRTTQNNTLTTQNNNLTTQNSTLSSQNSTLAAQNNTLTSQNSTLQAAINALPANDPLRTTYQNQINANNATIAANNTTISNNTTTINNNNTTIANNNTTINANNTQITQNNTAISELNGKIDNLSSLISGINLDDYSNEVQPGPVARYLTISDSFAQLGNIYVRGDRLRGSGMLDAPGDAEIKITNNGPSFLVLKNLTIAPDEGGKVYFNNVDVANNGEVNQVNGLAGGANLKLFTAESAVDASGQPVTAAKPRILVESKYDPLDPMYLASTPADVAPLAPDIILQGDISNTRGLVKIDSAAGSIRLEQKRDANGNLITPVETATIRADTVEVATRNGDFVQSYTDSFFHTAGGPLTMVPGDSQIGTVDRVDYTPETAGAGIVANGSVLIAARYLNINGNIQSGIPEWGVNVPANPTVALGSGSGSLSQALADYNAKTPAQKAIAGAEFYEVNGANVTGLGTAASGKWEQIKVYFNAKENRLEVSGVQVQGGYIELFGQIFNTNQNGGGQLRVLDGYGQIKVNNGTDLPIWINTLDAGRGVQGKINITNVVGLDAQGRPVIDTKTYTRGVGASREGTGSLYSYSPAAGLRYAMTVGADSGRTEYYRYSQSGWFDIRATFSSLALDQYRLRTVPTTSDPLSRGELLSSSIRGVVGSPQLDTQTESLTTNRTFTPGRSWKECNWWTLCANATYYTEFSISTSTKTVKTTSVKADHPIKISYIGHDQGLVQVNSTGGVVINGAINNRNGDTSITSTQGSINRSGDQSVVSGNNINLQANTGIGSTTAPMLVKVKEGGLLNATSNSGDVRVKQVLGNLRVGTVGGTGVANVMLEADRSILNGNANAYVQGRRVELVSHNGGVGELSAGVDNPLTVRTGYSANQADWPNNGLMVSARESINVSNVAQTGQAAYSGNLLLISAESLAGDVKIRTSGGLIDNNPFATTDLRTQDELAELWDSLRLRGQGAVDKADEAVAAFARGKKNNYELYWQLRRQQPDGGTVYNEAYQYQVSDAERAVLRTGRPEGETDAAFNAFVNNFAANRTAQYHQLHAEVGGFTTAYDRGYTYTVSAAEDAQIRRGSSWSDAQLMLSVGAGLLKNITDTVVTIKEPNAKGRNVQLIAGTGIGSYDAPQVIDLSAGLDALTVEQKAALAAAERGDAVLAGNIITITRPRPVNVAVGSGALTATTATGDLLIGSEQDLRLDQVSAPGDVRIKTAGALINGAAAGTTNVSGRNVILEAANGGIGVVNLDGEVTEAMRIDVDGNLIARAAGDISLDAQDDLAVDTIYSRQDVTLVADGSLLDAHVGESTVTPETNIRSRSMRLTARSGSIGTFTNALDVGVNADGRVHAFATTPGQGVHLFAPAGERLNIGTIRSGDALSLGSSTDMTIDGEVSALGPLSLTAGGTMRLTDQADVHATTQGLRLRAGSLRMDDAGNGSDAAQIRVDLGSIDIETVGDALITGIQAGRDAADAVRIVSTAGRILDSGDTRVDIMAMGGAASQVTLVGAQGVGNDPLDVATAKISATSGGVVDLAFVGDIDIVGIEAGNRVLLTADGSITGNSVVSTGLGVSNPDQSVFIRAESGLVNLQQVSGTADVQLAAPTEIQIGSVTVGGGFFAASDRITASVQGTGADAHGGALTGWEGGRAARIDAVFDSPTAFRLDTVSTVSGLLRVPTGEFWVSEVDVSRTLTLLNPQTTLLIDQTSRRLKDADVQLYTGGAPFSLGLFTNHVDTDAWAIGRRPSHEVLSANGNNTSTVEESNNVFTENRSVDTTRGAAPAVSRPGGAVTVSADGAVSTDNGQGNCPDGAQQCE